MGDGFVALLALRVVLALDAARPALGFIARHRAWGLSIVVRENWIGLRRWLAGLRQSR